MKETQQKVGRKPLKQASRRRILKVLGISAVTMTVGSVLPARWNKPLLQCGTLPVHAQTSGDTVIDPPAPTTRYSIALTVYDPDGLPIESDPSLATLIGAFWQLLCEATITPPPADATPVSFTFGDGTILTAPSIAGVATILNRADQYADRTGTPWIQRIQASVTPSGASTVQSSIWVYGLD